MDFWRYSNSRLCRTTEPPLVAMSKAIPQPPGIPVLGNIFDVSPNNTWSSLNKLAKKYGTSTASTLLLWLEDSSRCSLQCRTNIQDQSSRPPDCLCGKCFPSPGDMRWKSFSEVCFWAYSWDSLCCSWQPLCSLLLWRNLGNRTSNYGSNGHSLCQFGTIWSDARNNIWFD